MFDWLGVSHSFKQMLAIVVGGVAGIACFVGLTLLIDQGEEAAQGRWQASEERYEDLGELLAATTDPAIVVLGPPGGAGKGQNQGRKGHQNPYAPHGGQGCGLGRDREIVHVLTYDQGENVA